MTNALLGRLSDAEYARLAPFLAAVRLGSRDTVQRAGEPRRAVYFPVDAVFSQVVELADGGTVSTGMVGRESAVNLGLLVGAGRATRNTVVQIAGEALRVDADTFLREIAGRPGETRRMLEQAYERYTAITALLAGCVATHAIERRFAHRLLMIADRTGGARFPLTHEAEALMLGVRRASVTLAASRLRERGAIEYRSGEVAIANRAALEAAACSCYGQVRELESAAAAGGP